MYAGGESMTYRERFIRTLKCERIGGQVPHAELDFSLSMEAIGRPATPDLSNWKQMSPGERKACINYMADASIEVARKYDLSTIFVANNSLGAFAPNPEPFHNADGVQLILEAIREKSGDEFFLMMHGDNTWGIPTGDKMMEFSVQMYEEPEVLHEISKRRTEAYIEFAQKIDDNGHLLDGFVMCADYCFNVNPFFSPEQFEEFNVPYLKELIAEYRKLGFYSIKHTDGNVMPILKMIADCKPDAIHSLDPQAGVDLKEARKIVGKDMCLIGNVNCGLLQTGTYEEVEADVMRSLTDGMENETGYVFSASNVIYTGLPLERFEFMWNLWKQHGVYSF